jgi:hypothetical protein
MTQNEQMIQAIIEATGDRYTHLELDRLSGTKLLAVYETVKGAK